MNTLLRALYRGKICPGQQTITQTPEEKRQQDDLIERQMTLLDGLDTPTQALCRRVWDDMNAASAQDCEAAYIEGMRMGARLALALLGEE